MNLKDNSSCSSCRATVLPRHPLDPCISVEKEILQSLQDVSLAMGSCPEEIEVALSCIKWPQTEALYLLCHCLHLPELKVQVLHFLQLQIAGITLHHIC